uniref:Uncharacterized protein n=1 Tax=Theileria annulata TaxID=5874 RepID=A0A3B0NDS8_THEAN
MPIFTILSECTTKTKYLFHGSFTNPKTGFGGWTLYASEHKKLETEQISGQQERCDENAETKDVHAWFWHFFDIFIYTLHYRESYSYL